MRLLGIPMLKLLITLTKKQMTKKDKKIIEDSEARGIPIFVLTAKDKLSLDGILAYQALCKEAGCSKEHVDGVIRRANEFEDWQGENRTKLPD
jgi:hypothetical protein